MVGDRVNRPMPHEWQRARLEAYQQAQSSFDETRVHEYTSENGWHIDDYEQELPAEPPGPPLARGAFAAAQQVLRNYSFPPPDLITGVFVPDTPLEQRVMALRGRFLVFTFWFGVRVNKVTSEQRPLPDGGQEAVWGYSYRTLQGHFEQGQIDFTVHKDLVSGRVIFRIHAVSKTGLIRNPFYRLGFRLFGRALQRRFAHESMKRTLEQVQELLRTGSNWFGPAPSNPSSPEPVPAHEVPDEIAEKVKSG